MNRPKHRLSLFIFVLCSAGLCSCLEMVRRDEPGGGKPDRWWTESGNPSEPGGVNKEKPLATTAEGAVTTAESAVTTAEDAVTTVENAVVGPPQSGPALPPDQSLIEAHAKRSRSQEETTRQINEYAYWCIENNMWDEARLHLERAVSEDSLSASLYNNLGVIYERLGKTDQADSAYTRATALLPDRGAYEANLMRLRDRAVAATAFPDSSSDVAASIEDHGADGSSDEAPANE